MHLRARFLIGFTVLSILTAGASAQSPSPAAGAATPAAKTVRISFLPPPLEGTLSLGIYDPKGKLVRVLHRESDVDDFDVGHDALSTNWDGKDDAGQLLPSGKYHARGFVVGDIEVEGIGFYFNDWVSSDRQDRIARICGMATDGERLVLTAKTVTGEPESFVCNSTGEIIETRAGVPSAEDCEEASRSTRSLPPARGRDNTHWVIEEASPATNEWEVRQYSATNELLRSLKIAPEDPQPRAVAASEESDRIFLLEENATMQRVRGLSLLATSEASSHPTSDWKVEFEKKIVAHKDFTTENGTPVVSGAQSPAAKIALKLPPNPLERDEKATVELAAGSDAEGSFLKTADGLPLQTISETPQLSRIVMVRSGDNAVDVFQDDGSVVEQFRLSGIDAMMAFDCGEIELK